jgi:hypothetical protein
MARIALGGSRFSWKDYFRKALMVNPKDKLAKEGLGDLKKMSRK